MVKAAGGTTAYSDRHTGAYTMLQGPSGDALDEIYNPEQSANSAASLTDYQYDQLHVRSEPTPHAPASSALAPLLNGSGASADCCVDLLQHATA